jgi:hypothetical protein
MSETFGGELAWNPSDEAIDQTQHPYGVENMSIENLSRLTGRLQDALDASSLGDSVTETDAFEALNREISELIRKDPERGKQLCQAMVDSQEWADRTLIVANMVDLHGVDERLASQLWARLLADEDTGVHSMGRSVLQGEATRGNIDALGLIGIVDELSEIARSRGVDSVRARTRQGK